MRRYQRELRSNLGQIIHLGCGDVKETVYIAVNLRMPPAGRVKSVSLTGPEHKDIIKLKFKPQANSVSFTVPQVKTYEIAVVTLE